MQVFRDKAVLITGGSSGIGRALALRLGGHGAKIALAARNRDALEEVCQQIRQPGSAAVAIPTDVTDSSQVRHAVEETVARFGGLDILVCSAGLSLRAYFEGTSLEALERVMQVNFFGTLYATYFALPHVKERHGSLVAISSLTGKRGIPSYALYGASKFAIQGLYEALQLELARDGVHVGIVSPGFVNTPLRENVLGPDGKPFQKPPDPPLRVFPVEKCVDRIVRLIARRRRETLLPRVAGAMLFFDRFTGNRLGDYLLKRFFPPDNQAPNEQAPSGPRPSESGDGVPNRSTPDGQGS